QEDEKGLNETDSKIYIEVEKRDDHEMDAEMAERIKDPTSKVMIYYPDDTLWSSKTTNTSLKALDDALPRYEDELQQAIKDKEDYNSKITISNQAPEIMVVGRPLRSEEHTSEL